MEISVLEDYKWKHFNTWRWPYFMKCGKAESTHLWISCQRTYRRCILTKFTNMQYGTDEESYEPIGGMIWGYPGQIQGSVGNLYNQLFVIEKVFKTKAEAISDLISFKIDPDPDFSKILDDIFGDG